MHRKLVFSSAITRGGLWATDTQALCVLDHDRPIIEAAFQICEPKGARFHLMNLTKIVETIDSRRFTCQSRGNGSKEILSGTKDRLRRKNKLAQIHYHIDKGYWSSERKPITTHTNFHYTIVRWGLWFFFSNFFFLLAVMQYRQEERRQSNLPLPRNNIQSFVFFFPQLKVNQRRLHSYHFNINIQVRVMYFGHRKTNMKHHSVECTFAWFARSRTVNSGCENSDALYATISFSGVYVFQFRQALGALPVFVGRSIIGMDCF